MLTSGCFIQGYSFDDVLLIPKHSSISSRDDVDLSVSLPKDIDLKIPLVSANMSSVTDVEMAKTIAELGGLAILHRFDDYSNLFSNFDQAQSASIGFSGAIGASVGIKQKDLDLIHDLNSIGCKIICVDVAHGDHSKVADFVSLVHSKYPHLLIIAGNVVTANGASLLWEAGADIIKVGVGSGSICNTRIETGNGYPQLSALDIVCNYENYKMRGDQWPMFISDGGVRSAGDCVKSLAFADLVMIGNLFAGTDESPGEIIQFQGKKFKRYAGSSTHKQKHVEGVAGLVPYKGSVRDIVIHLAEGIRSGCSYQGARNLADLKSDPKFVVISNAGLVESHPHNVML
jgi:IMP dehydrogenase